MVSATGRFLAQTANMQKAVSYYDVIMAGGRHQYIQREAETYYIFVVCSYFKLHLLDLLIIWSTYIFPCYRGIVELMYVITHPCFNCNVDLARPLSHLVKDE